MLGLINLNKPQGITSRTAVNQVHRWVRPAKVGHCGTLDPLATGVLVVCVGSATRLANYVQAATKSYVGQFRLGVESETEDIEGELEPLQNPPQLTAAEIEAALPEFVGIIEQIPPRFSALRVNGKRAYDLARKGVKVDMQARQVHVKSIQLLSFEYPNMTLEIQCGAGTYIRSLGRDIARRVGSGAVMTALERTAIGDFRIEQAVSPEVLNDSNIHQYLCPPRQAVSDLPYVSLTKAQVQQISFGSLLEFKAAAINVNGAPPCELAGVDEQGTLVAILRQKVIRSESSAVAMQDGGMISYAPAINFVGRN